MEPQAETPQGNFTTDLLITNIHCPSCVSYVQDVLRPLPQIYAVDVSIIDHVVRVRHEGKAARELTSALLNAAFEVQHVSTRDDTGRQISDYAVHHEKRNTKSTRLWPKFMTKAQKKHIANCDACQSQLAKDTITGRVQYALHWSSRHVRQLSEASSLEKGEGLKHPSASTIDNRSSPTTDLPTSYIAELTIGGMTCASCSGTITQELKTQDFVESVDVNLLTHSGKVRFKGAFSDGQKLVEAIEDMGYEADINSISVVTNSQNKVQKYKAYLSIEGMTCGSCVGTISRGLEELSELTSVSVDLMGNSAVVEFEYPLTINEILAKIEGIGYDGSLVKIDELTVVNQSAISRERDLTFEIHGMYCPRCPANVTQALQERFGNQVAILTNPTLDNPLISLRYKPNSPTLTARQLRDVIESVDAAIHASVYHPPSIEERSRKLQRKERNRLLRHFLLTLIVAIPTFVIGIVYMSLVPESNPTRQWFEESIWSGTVMRMEWALFIMTTPVFFYGASIFHSRALVEIWSLWRPGSKVPFGRRLYRFGSMNLLISAGTSVAYFSSLAVLIMEATAAPASMQNTTGRHSDTYFDTVTFLTFFILIGRFLEAYSKSKTGDAVAMLGNLRPVEALLLEFGLDDFKQEAESIRKIPIDLLEIGDRVKVPYGASPPVDGEIDEDGVFVFDESSLTGESKPVNKSRGDKVLTGSVNVSNPVAIKVGAIGSHSMLDQIISVVREGQAKRAPVERLADTITGYFTPVITLLAIMTWIIWLALGTSGALPQQWLNVDQGGWAFWSVEFAIAVFVVACPCGIGLAAPTALFVGGGLAAKAGILVQGGGQAFQEASHIDAIVFDKTGTLTAGQMKVTDMHLVNDKSDAERVVLILKLAKALEESSTHPIAKAITEYCQQTTQDVDIRLQQSDVQETSGRGMIGTFQVQQGSSGDAMTIQAAIGNEKLLQEFQKSESSPSTKTIASAKALATTTIETSAFLTQTIGTLQATGVSTPIFYLRQLSDSADIDNIWRPVAIFAIADPIRPEANMVLQTLRDSGIEVHMCTGDNPTTALAIASQLQIPATHVRAGVLPQNKAAYINEIQHNADNKRRIVAFVGDGTNDTPALSAADVSIALSTGSDVAITAASFILLNSELTTILKLVKLAKRVFFRVKLNFMWAAVYNVCLIPVAAGVFFPIGQWRLSPVWASLAMALSSVSVVLSSLALRLPELNLKIKVGERKTSSKWF